MKSSRKKKQFFIATIDVLLLILSIFLSLVVRNKDIPKLYTFTFHLVSFIPVIIFWIAGLYTLGLYSLEMPFTGPKATFYIFLVALTSMFFGFAIFYLPSDPDIMPKTIMALFSGIAFCLIFLWRWFFNTISDKIFSKISIAFVGVNDTVLDLIKNMNHFSYMGYNALYLFDEDYRETWCNNIPVISDFTEFTTQIEKSGVHLVVLASEKELSKEVRRTLFDMLQHQIQFINIPDFYEIYLRKIPIGAINELWFLRNIDLRAKKAYAFFKRILDIIFSAAALCVTAVLWPFIMLAIKLESPGPVFFRQVRLGHLGKPFTILKFRSMKVTGNDFAPTGINDKRITSLGKFLRKTRIDELPQLINILKGDMSLIGPRPERPDLAKELEKEIPFYNQRLLVKPGITGWDQVSGEYHSPSIEDTYKKMQYDLYYIKNMSLFLDMSIFFKTIMTVFRRAGR